MEQELNNDVHCLIELAFYLEVEGDVGQDDPARVDDQRRDLVAHGLK